MNQNSKLKRLCIVVYFLTTSLLVKGMIPAEISVVIAKQFGYSYDENVMSSEDPIFVSYIHKNWRDIADKIEWLPLAVGDRIPEKVAFNSSVMNFGQTCESLPPLEYLDFFEKMLSLAEEKRISFGAIEFLYMAEDEKDCFFSVNWEHQRVQKILERFRKLIPEEEETLLNMVDLESKGGLADNYMTNKSGDAPLPETLPGIKLQRPWASLIKKYELMTGKKVDVPYNPHYNPRPEKVVGNELGGTSIPITTAPIWLNPWFWMISGGLTFIIGIFAKMRQSLNRKRKV